MPFFEQLPLTFAVLIMAYLLSGLGSTLSEYFLYGLSYLRIGMSVAMHRYLRGCTCGIWKGRGL